MYPISAHELHFQARIWEDLYWEPYYVTPGHNIPHDGVIQPIKFKEHSTQ